MIRIINKEEYFKERNTISSLIEDLFYNDNDNIAVLEETIEHLDFIFSQEYNDSFLLLDIEDDKLKCMANFLEINNIEKTWCVFSIFTRKSLRKKGLAENILNIGLDKIKNKKANKIIAGIEYDNIKSQKLHEKEGFVYEGKEWNFYAKGFPNNHMGYIMDLEGDK